MEARLALYTKNKGLLGVGELFVADTKRMGADLYAFLVSRSCLVVSRVVDS